MIITENGENILSTQKLIFIPCNGYPIPYNILNSFAAGMDDPNRHYISLNKALNDDKRISYHKDYLSNLSAAIRYKHKPDCLTA